LVTSRIGDIVVDCADPSRLARFWSEVLGYRVSDEDATGVAISGSAVMPAVLFIRVPEGRVAKNRIHFDVCATDRDHEEELARLLALGARRSGIEAGGRWTVLEDPEGNEFCLMHKRVPAEPLPLHG
jgi:catechol-2,3-dioxygenase